MNITTLAKTTHEAGNKIYELQEILGKEEGLDKYKTELGELSKQFDRWANSLESVLTDQEFEKNLLRNQVEREKLHKLVSDLVEWGSEFKKIKPVDKHDEKFINVVLRAVANYKKVL